MWLDRELSDLLSELAEQLGRDPRVAIAEQLGSLARGRSRLKRADPEARKRIAERTAMLRAPLAAALASAMSPDPSWRAARDAVSLIRRLNCIIGNLSATSGARLRADEIDLDYARLDAAALVRHVSEAFRWLAEERRVTLRIDVPRAETPIEADPIKLQKVLLNLLFNAFKHTDLGGEIRCQLVAGDERAPLRIRVSDNGRGVAPADAELIFDRARHHERSAMSPELLAGFHLATSRDIARLHGGDLILEEGSGGAAFTLEVPPQAPAGIEVAPEAPPLGERAAEVARVAAAELRTEAELGRRPVERRGRALILIADDTPSIQRIVVESLESEYAIACAHDAAKARDRADLLRPDLVVVDMALPDAEKLIRSLRLHPELGEIPLLGLVEAEAPAEMVRLLESQVRDLLHKPILLPELRARIGHLIREKRTRELLSETIGRHETDLVKLADEVAQHQRRLEDALAEVESARRFAERASRIKSNFLRMMSHELRTPITAMQLQTHLLERTADMTPEVTAGLERISRSVTRLSHLIETVLHWARVESGRYRPWVEEVDLAALAAEVITELGPVAERKQVAIAFEAPPEAPMKNDRRLLGVALINLLTRALTRSRPGGTLSVEVEIDAEHGRVTIEDPGAPTPAARRAQLFEPVWEDRDFQSSIGEGSGLGLHVVNDIVKALGGEIGFAPDAPDRERIVLTVPRFATG